MRASVTLYEDHSAFAHAVAQPLQVRAVGNNTFLGVLERMGPSPKHLRAAVWDGSSLILAALRTPPYVLNLAHAGRGRDGVAAIAEALTLRNVELPGVVSDTNVARAFAEAWAERNPIRIESGGRHLLYEANRVVHPRGIPGALAMASRANSERHIAWETAFAVDIDAPQEQRGRSLVSDRVERWLAGNVLFDWVVGGGAVAHGVVMPIGADGARVLAIYTSPDNRGRGYAQAMTAALTQRALDAGRWCTLFTDADNPITNKIYPRVGYRYLDEYTDFDFRPL